MSVTERLTCSDCGCPLHESFDRLFQVCTPCFSRWRALAVIGSPSLTSAPARWRPIVDVLTDDERDHLHRLMTMPVSTTINLLDSPLGRQLLATDSTDDFEDADDTDSEPLPASDWWAMSDGERERATKRQQT